MRSCADALLNDEYTREQYAVSPRQRDLQVLQLAPFVVLTRPGRVLEPTGNPSFGERGDPVHVRGEEHSELKPRRCTAVRLIICCLLCAARWVAEQCLLCGEDTEHATATATPFNALSSMPLEVQRSEYFTLLAAISPSLPDDQRRAQRVRTWLGMPRARAPARLPVPLPGSGSGDVFSEGSSEDGREEPL